MYTNAQQLYVDCQLSLNPHDDKNLEDKEDISLMKDAGLNTSWDGTSGLGQL